MSFSAFHTPNPRFRWPPSINTSFAETRDASRYGYSYYQYSSNFNFQRTNEFVLIAAVIRPTGFTNKKLPVLVWIYGGGLYAGSTAGPQYNLSGIIRISQDTNTPIIAVSMNYRLGKAQPRFLQSPQILAEGSSNTGLLDQRLALRWIQENIEAFGGDPSRVTIWGESAGAQSIELHLNSYGVRDDGLSHATIMESGDPFFAAQTRQVWNPIVNGDLLQSYLSTTMDEGDFVKVPLLIGANPDEGVSFSVHGLDNTTAMSNSLTIQKPLDLYPKDDFANESTYDAAIGGDLMMIAQRRKMCEFYTQAAKDVYSYRFDTPLWNQTAPTSVLHFVNFVFSFRNVSGALGPSPRYESYKDLSTDIGRAYVNFVETEDPNGIGNSKRVGLPAWPKYALAAPKNMVLNSNGSYVEDDTWRNEGIAFINSLARELLA
ncbi:alpha/beta-hydrolase [Lindgomyces ingoldianus]|uniref:Alpha/beta-hydrolase n=1 Tax=Lindgomyces ingoldianus TaxID=673940 RepID=A0ACB6RB20_9PLEO|nr:alpha/beta-hydrolase [Lindgomyces ingoldianus]KAF2476336.1 alpha/beta-hydrolase [Lindgomyces ingoldianus]